MTSDKYESDRMALNCITVVQKPQGRVGDFFFTKFNALC